MRIIKAILIFFHLVMGLCLIIATGAIWRPLSPLVKATKRWWLGRILTLMSVETQVYGELPENDGDQGMLFVSNHVSWLDIPMIGSLQQINFLSKAEVRRWPLIGRLAESTGTLFIKRGSGDSYRIKQEITERIEQGHSVLFFPEGTTTDGNSVKRFHRQLFNVNPNGSTRVCPVIITYEVDGELFNPVAFIGDDDFAEHLWHLLGFNHIRACVEFLPARDVNANSLRSDVQQLENEMRGKVERRSRRIKLDIEAKPDKPTPATA